MIGVAVSYLFVGAVLLLASFFERIRLLSDEGSRKLIHVAVAHWILIAIVFFEGRPLLASVVPASFILLNYLSYRFNLLSAMERDERRAEDLGTVYYAISLTIVSYIAFRYDLLAHGAIAILAMGYADGLGAVLGKRFGRRKLYHMKTYIGSLAVFFFTFVITYGFFQTAFVTVLVLSLATAAVELYTPKGFDNLTVPLFLFFSAVVLIP